MDPTRCQMLTLMGYSEADIKFISSTRHAKPPIFAPQVNVEVRDEMAETEIHDRSSEQGSKLQAPPFLYDSIVTALVGPEEKRFDLHKGLLCQSSGFFKAAFEGKFKEGKRTIKLPEQDPETFKYLVHWLYTNNLRGYFYSAVIKPSTKELRVEADEVKDNEDLDEHYVLNISNPKFEPGT